MFSLPNKKFWLLIVVFCIIDTKSRVTFAFIALRKVVSGIAGEKLPYNM